jgi:hypothetical protein
MQSFVSIKMHSNLKQLYMNLEKVDIKTILSKNKYKTFNCSEEIKTSLIDNTLS